MKKAINTLDILCLVLFPVNSALLFLNGNITGGLGWACAAGWVMIAMIRSYNTCNPDKE